jgi:tyrosyl-tRNA synthetase
MGLCLLSAIDPKLKLPRDSMTPEEELAVFTRGAAECLTEEDLLKKIKKAREGGRPLRIKLGADPSAPDIHLGHTVVLWKMRQIQDLGHQVTFLIGDFTGRIGDPTGKSDTRPALTEADVQANAETYKKQIFKVLDPEKTKIQFNSEWLGELRFDDVIRLASKTTVAHMLERQDFGNRYADNRPIHLHEFFYALAQGYDSVAMDTDVELGGQDQRFNFVTTRDLQRAYQKAPEAVVMMPILNGLCGTRKMSKSLDNYIGVDEPPRDIFGKLMSLSDTLMWEYYTLLSRKTLAEIESLQAQVAAGTLHPMEAKKFLAEELTERFHPGKGREAREGFAATVQKKRLPDEIPSSSLKDLPAPTLKLFELLVHCFGGSTSDARRMAKQGAVKQDGEKLMDPLMEVTPQVGQVVQMGKRRFVRFV